MSEQFGCRPVKPEIDRLDEHVGCDHSIGIRVFGQNSTVVADRRQGVLLLNVLDELEFGPHTYAIDTNVVNTYNNGDLTLKNFNTIVIRMGQAAVVIPEKIYFKIGEVCELVGVQAHVLRYWETEFPQLSPQKNRSGQRSYRRRDVEISLRIKELLYDEMFTIAGARKKLQLELRGDAPKLKIVHPEPNSADTPSKASSAPGLFDEELELGDVAGLGSPHIDTIDPERREALRNIASQLLELREMLKNGTPR